LTNKYFSRFFIVDNFFTGGLLLQSEIVSLLDFLNKCTPLKWLDIQIKASEIRSLRKDSSTPNFKHNIPSTVWINNFLDRHDLISRISIPINNASLFITKEIIVKFYEDTNQICKSYLDDIENIHFFHQIKINFEITLPVIVPKGTKTIYTRRKQNHKFFASVKVRLAQLDVEHQRKSFSKPQIWVLTWKEN
jgi:hypothetical protein